MDAPSIQEDRLPVMVLALVLAATASLILATVPALPDYVATRFGSRGRAIGWMSREGYLWFTLVFSIGLPSLLALAIGWLPARFPAWTNIPHRAYWLAPERLQISLRSLRSHGCWLGAFVAAMAGAMHWLIVKANALQPPALASGPFIAWMVVMLSGIGLWAWRLYRRFRRVA